MAIIFLLLLSNFSRAEEMNRENPENCNGINAFRCRKPNEADILKKYLHLAQRDGNTLKLNIQNGKHLQFEDCKDTSCDIYQYRLQEYFGKYGYFLIKKQTIEEATYLFVNLQTGNKIDIDELPLFSLDAHRFITISFCESFCTNRIQIWKFSQNEIKLEWSPDSSLYKGSWADGSARWIDNATIEVTQVMRINLENQFESRKAFLIKLSPEGWRVVNTK